LKLESGKTEIFYGIEEVSNSLLRFFSNAHRWFGVVANSHGAPIVMEYPPYVNAYDNFVNNRGGKIQWITEVTKDNLSYIKKLMQYAQIRHLDNIKGFAFGVSETEYVATEVMQVAQPLALLTYSNMKVIVEQQRYLFQNLWDKATPAEQKIKEIEEGIEPPRTELIRGIERSMPHIISFWNRAKTTMNVAADISWPILAIQEPRFREIITDAYARNIRIRVITDITKDNIEHCKQLTQYCELYHSERTKGNLAVSDTEYVSWSNVADMQNLSFVISNEREIVEQQTYLFESLLSKAIPAQLKIREIEEGIEPENTEFFYGAEATTSAILEWMSRLGKMDAVVDPTAPSVAMGLEPLRNAYIIAKKRGVKIRWVTEITKDNVRYCKEAMNLEIEIRHLDGIKGNFAVSENVYIAAATLEEAKPVPVWMRSTVKMFREQQQYVFDTLWNKAIPAEHRINEIEKNIPAERTEVVSDPHGIESFYKNIINNAKQEIMLILPTTVDTFANEKRIAIIDSLKESAKRNVKIRILVHSKREDYDTAEEQDINNNLKPQGILVNQLSIRPIQEAQGHEGEEEGDGMRRVITVIADNKTSLVIELKNDEKENFVDAIGSAVLSTGKALASSYARIFESLWQEAGLSAKLRESDKMQREFINIAAHELRTPIQPILGAAEMMEFEFQNDSEKVEVSKEDVEIIIRNASRLGRLSSDILELARIESSGLNLHKSPFNIREIISKALIDAKGQIQAENNNDDSSSSSSSSNVNLHYEPRDIAVYADKDRISQVVYNLLSNAIKFTKRDSGGDIYLTTEKDNNNNSLIVTVKDTGSGIDPEIMPRLFTKFATKSDRGTGLGLFLSKNIVEAHGGKIWAENNNSSYGNGATFTFVLPLTEESRR
jgi:two-component system, OmpR family, sensor histidine kinase VicK